MFLFCFLLFYHFLNLKRKQSEEGALLELNGAIRLSEEYIPYHIYIYVGAWGSVMTSLLSPAVHHTNGLIRPAHSYRVMAKLAACIHHTSATRN